MSSANRFIPSGGGRLNPLDLGRGDWQIDGVPVIVTAAQINSLAGTGSSPVTFIYVDGVDGNDSVGNGQIGNPFKTIGAANAFVTDATFEKPYTIVCGTAQYAETTFSPKPYVYLDLCNSTLTCDNPITLDPSWDDSFADIVSWYVTNGTIDASHLTLDFSAFATSYQALISFIDVEFENAPLISMIGNNLVNSQAISLTAIGGIDTVPSIVVNNAVGQVSNANIGSVTTTATTGFASLILNSSLIQGNVEINTSGGAQAQNILMGNFLPSPVSINGVDSFLLIDPTSFNQVPIGTHATNYSLLGVSNGVNANYTPLNYTPTDSSVKGHLEGIDSALLSSISKIVSLTDDYTILPTDDRALFLCNPLLTSTLTITVPGGSTLIKGFTFSVKQRGNDETVKVVVVSAASNQIDEWPFSTLGFENCATYILEDNTDNASIHILSSNGLSQDISPIFNTNIETYTITSRDNGYQINFPSTSSAKTLTLPDNGIEAIRKGFWCKVYVPSGATNSLTISSTDTIEGPTIILPGQSVEIFKQVYGGPNKWVVTLKQGDFTKAKKPFVLSGANYTMSGLDLSENIIIDTANGTVTLPVVGSAAPQGFVFNIHNKTSTIAVVQPVFGGNYIDGYVYTRMQPFETLQLVSDGSDTYHTLSRSSNFRQSGSNLSDTSYADLTNNGNYFALSINHVVYFKAKIIGSDVASNYYGAFTIEGCIKRGSDGVVAFVGTPLITILGRTNANFDAQAIADDTNKRLTFQVRGDTGQVMRWAAKIECFITQNGT